jgi:hypothetical protein
MALIHDSATGSGRSYDRREGLKQILDMTGQAELIRYAIEHRLVDARNGEAD